MRIRIDHSKCVKCGQCLAACPYLKDEKSEKIFSCDECGKCAAACPKKAFYEAGGSLRIDSSRCNNCEKCVDACPREAIVPQLNVPAKCDLCPDHEKPLCVSACVYGAIALELDDREKKRMGAVLGWKKLMEEGELVEQNNSRAIIRANGELVYYVLAKEPSYDETMVAEGVIDRMRKNQDFSESAEATLEQHCCLSHILIGEEQRLEILRIVNSEVSGFSALDFFLDDESLEEISVIGHEKPVYVYHRNHGWMRSNIVMDSNEKTKEVINRLGRSLGRRVTLQKPRINANLKLGRLHAAVNPVTVDGACITIRRFKSRPFEPYELVENGTITAREMAFLSMAAECDLNILVCGNTGSGKTSTLNTISKMLPETDRIIIIEETPEMIVEREHVVRLTVSDNTSMHELVEDTLRMRPDRVIVGEVRTQKEVGALMNTMLAGQGKSSLATFHSQNAEEALLRLASLGVDPVDLCALDLIVVQRRMTDLKKRKDVRRITEMSCVKKDYMRKPEIVRIFSSGKEVSVSENPCFERIMSCNRMTKKQALAELKRREKMYA